MKLSLFIACISGPVAMLTVLATDVPAASRSSDAIRAGGDAVRGQQLYERRCIACHSLDANRVGPRHRGLYGRRAGGLADYTYSPALAGAEVRWDDDTLDRWLADPQALFPGQRMNLRVRDARDRADLIAYLKQQDEEAGR